jgi:hypothetical protein
MTTLEEAWRWFEDVNQTLERMQRMGERYCVVSDEWIETLCDGVD